MANTNVLQPFPGKTVVRKLTPPTPLFPRALPLNIRASCVQQAQLFQGLTHAECIEVASMAQERHFRHQQTIFREGDPARFVVVLIAGRAKLTQLSRSGAEIILRVAEAGELLGGIGLSRDATSRLTAQALGPCQVFTWEARSFAVLEERIPAVRHNAVTILAERLNLLEERFLELATEQVGPRLARMLVRLLGHQNGHSVRRIELSQEELGQIVGTTLFTVSRILGEWEKRGLVQTQRKAVVIVDVSGLIELAEAGKDP